MRKNIERMGEEKIGTLLLSFSIPAIIGMLVNALYTVVDRIFVGRGVDPLALSGITYTFPLTMIVLGLSMLVGIGGTTLVSIRLGEGRLDEAEKIVYNSFIMAIMISIVITILGYIFLDPMLAGFGATGEVFNYAKEFVEILLIANIFQIMSFVMNSLLRGAGKAKLAMTTLLVSAGLNILLNPLFIFVLKLGIRGSALATLISLLISFVWVLACFMGDKAVLKLKIRGNEIDYKLMKKIAVTGLGPFIMQTVAGLILFIFNHQLFRYGGDYAVASMGIVNGVLMLFAMPIFGLNQAVQPIVGYNYGAKKPERMMEALRLGIIAATAICIAGFAIVLGFSEHILRIFSDKSEELIAIGKNGISIFIVMFPLIGFQIIGTGFFQAVGKVKEATFLSLLRQVILLIPFLFILPLFFKLNGVWAAGPASDFGSFIFTAFILYRGVKEIKKELILKNQVTEVVSND